MSCKNRWAAAAALVGLLAVSGLAERATAQITANASISAIANVTGVAPLTAAGVNDLLFGSVTAGTPKTVTAPSNMGRFSISGQPSTPVTVTFTLPTVLTGTGSSTIPITFGSADGLNWSTFPTTFTTFDPNSPFFTSLHVTTGALTIGLTGTVSPPTLTTTDVYTGTVTLTVAY